MARTIGKTKVRFADDSLVLTIPVKVRKELHIEGGDTLLWRFDYATHTLELQKHQRQEKLPHKNY